MSKTFLFQTIQFSVNTPFEMSKTALYQTLQFSINTVFVYAELNLRIILFKQFSLA